MSRVRAADVELLVLLAILVAATFVRPGPSPGRLRRILRADRVPPRLRPYTPAIPAR